MIGRWRCLLCQRPRWVKGTYESWMKHYRTMHTEDD